MSLHTSRYRPRFYSCPVQTGSCLYECKAGIELLGEESVVKACAYLKIYTEVLTLTFAHKQSYFWLSEDERGLKTRLKQCCIGALFKRSQCVDKTLPEFSCARRMRQQLEL